MNVDDVFRAEWSRVVGALMRNFGDLDLAEDAAQEAFVEATKRWPVEGYPDRPGAWLTTTARRKALDRVRRSSTYQAKLNELEARAKTAPAPESSELIDDQLALLLGCCHPALGHDAQVALTLRIVAGLSTDQIARAFLIEPGTMGRRLSRAKQKVRDAKIPFTTPDRSTLAERVEAVRHVIYLIFTEGHASRTDEAFVRGDLCDEATWLASLLTELLPGDAESHGLLALIQLTDARRSTRVDDAGEPVLLKHQDRSKWDRQKIANGMTQLGRAVKHGPVGPLGLQAAIAALHAGAPSFEETAWGRIVRTYDMLYAVNPSSIVALNRAAALSYADGPEPALAEVDSLEPELGDYLYFHTARADLLHRLGRSGDAIAAYEQALQCSPAPAEQAFVNQRLHELGAGDAHQESLRAD